MVRLFCLLLLLLLVSVVLGGTAGAQPAAPTTMQTGEPVSVGVAMAGIVIMAAGVGMMLHQAPCFYGSVCGSDPGWLMGGVAVVGAGVTVVYLGLRPRRIIIAPAVSRRAISVQGALVWGRR